MKHIILKISELSDSREIMEQRVFPAGVVFTYIVMIVVAVSLCWSYYGEIDVVIKARGEIKPSSQIHTIKNQTTGVVTQVYIQNGDLVSKGDVLYSINNENLLLKLENAVEESKDRSEELKMLQCFLLSIETDENQFEGLLSNGEIYDKTLIQKYINEYEQYCLVKSQSERTIDFLNQKLERAHNDKLGYQSILDGIKLGRFEIDFKSDNLYNLKFRSYLSSLKQQELSLNEKRDVLKKNETLYTSGAIPESVYISSNQELERMESEIDKYKADFALELEMLVENSILEISQYESELNRLLTTRSSGTLISASETKKVIELSSAIQIQENHLMKLDENIGSLKEQIRMSDVKAPFTGYVSLDTEVAVGDYIENSRFIGSIIPESEDVLRVTLYVSNEDIADISVGDKVKFRIDALPYKEYGTVAGYVTKIGAGTMSGSNSHNGYYIVEAEIPNEKLASYKGELSHMKVGMMVEGHIVTRTKRILNLLLEKLSLRN